MSVWNHSLHRRPIGVQINCAPTPLLFAKSAQSDCSTVRVSAHSVADKLKKTAQSATGQTIDPTCVSAAAENISFVCRASKTA